LTNCDGTDATIISQTSCSIPISTLRSSPYSHPWGADIYAKVVAINVVGTSPESVVGNGAQILTTPDAPINLADDILITNHQQIGITWEDGAFNGGSNIIDYRLWISTTGDYAVLDAGILTKSYTYLSA
jgi:hypothetical protein